MASPGDSEKSLIDPAFVRKASVTCARNRILVRFATCGRGVAAVLAALLTVAGCSPRKTVVAPAVSTVRFDIPSDPTTLNPLFAHVDANSVEQQLARLAFEPFIDVDERGRQIPVLLARVPTLANGDLSHDGRIITYHLRRNVHWQDGPLVTAHDVVFTLHAITDPNNPVRSREGYERITRVEQLDTSTVRVTLDAPWAPAVATIFSYGTAPQYVLPAHLLENKTELAQNAFNGAPVGNGPYRFRTWQRGERLIYTRNAAYWRGVPAVERLDKVAAEQLFHMLEGFADYGFPESHAASFALLAYASAYVKCHEPAIFCAAILNVQPMGFYSTEVLVNDARRHDVVVKPITANYSEWWSFVDRDGALRLGFHLVRGLGEAQRETLQAAIGDGEFEDILDFVRRSKLSREALENLAAADAFRPWFASRREAMWALRGINEREARGELGRAMDIEEPLATLAPLNAVETTTLDIHATGVSDIQPIAHFRKELDRKNILCAARLPAMPNHLVCKVGGLVITRQRPGTAKGFVFLTLEDETGLVNVIVRPDIYEQYRRIIRQSQALIIEGVLQKEQGCIDLLGKRFWPFDTVGTTDNIRARNFQ